MDTFKLNNLPLDKVFVNKIAQGGDDLIYLWFLTKDVEVKVTRKLENKANLTNNLQDMEIGNIRGREDGL